MSKRLTFLISGDLEQDLDMVIGKIKKHGVAMTQADLVRLGLSTVIRVLNPTLDKRSKQRIYTQSDVEELMKPYIEIATEAEQKKGGKP
ncbi:hypothetical protein AD945_03820 [Gluconobacter albidus]|uniref:Uncharacterized protein n=1 Tax=Gluconobacter albidus TaxID=318683 RepID=A0A149TLN6_9PROT|nr:hypothetical protein [Gluconobacter albidus]KXV49668.1 hypothetical protein AD945_03820 [Gluconobacter albidus]